MSKDTNIVVQMGRVVADPMIRYTPSGTAVCNFSLANNDMYVSNGEKKESVNYYDCQAWGKLAEVMTEYCKKGQQIIIEGRLKQDRWDDQDGKKRSKIIINIDNFTFVGGKKTESNEPSESYDDEIPY